jgi:hypothetical protein
MGGKGVAQGMSGEALGQAAEIQLPISLLMRFIPVEPFSVHLEAVSRPQLCG